MRRRQAIRRLLVALVDLHASAPGAGSTIAELIEAGWPGERILPSAAPNRFHNAMAVLRTLGLRGMLVTTEEGYMLDPAITVVRVKRRERD